MKFPVLCPGAIEASLLAIAVSTASPALADTLSIKIPTAEWELRETGGGGKRIDAPGFGHTTEPGKPMMPWRVFHIAVPPDARVLDVAFEGASRRVPGSFKIKAAGMLLPAREPTVAELRRARELYQRNFEKTYASDEPYPARPAVHLGGGGFRKYRLVRVACAPWQYQPKSGLVKHVPEIVVKIEYERTGMDEAPARLADTVKEARARKLIFNYDQAQQWYSPPVVTGAAPAEAPEAGPSLSDRRYVIMCTDATRDVVEILADWKRSIGYRVHVFTKEWLELNTNYPSLDFPRQIRYYLRDNYLEWGAEFFLIVGDHDEIPMRVCDSGSDGGDPMPSGTDLYYAELSLPDSQGWDDDLDGRYGEWDDDDIDWLLELDVGRIPDNDPSVVRDICLKIRAYELDYGSWKNRALLLGSIIEFAHEDTWDPPATCDSACAMEEMLNNWSWAGWNCYTMYEQEGLETSVFPSTLPLTKDMVRLAWDGGEYGLVNLAGHGNDFGINRRIWNTDDGDGIPEWAQNELTGPTFFDRTDIPILDDEHPSLTFFAGCSCGHYTSPDAVGKQVLENGAIASIAASEGVNHTNPWYSESDGTLFSLQYRWTRNIVEYGMDPGQALTAAKELYATMFTMDSGGSQLLLSMNYFGDPALDRLGVSQRSNLGPYTPPEWDYVIVPRATADAISSWCPVSPVLPGNTKSTYLNFGVTNNGTAAAYGVLNHLRIDDVFVRWVSWGWIGAGVNATHVNNGPFTVRGGRHTVKVVYDPNNELTETSESDNIWQRQYVWAPDYLGRDVPELRAPPPNPGTGTYYNCDGFGARLGGAEYWCAVGILSQGTTDNNDIRLHTDYTGSTNGFDSYHKWSADAGTRTDFCIANRRQTGSRGPYYYGVVRRSGGSGFWIQQSNSGAGLYRTGYNGPFTIGENDVVDMHEVFLVPEQWRVLLVVDDGQADLGLSIYDASGSYFSKAGAMPGGLSNSGGPGGDEDATVTIGANGYYGIAVWKNGSADAGHANTYYLGVFVDSDGDGLPDVWEQQIVDADPGDGIDSVADVLPGGDYDCDRSSNWDEFVARTDPCDRLSCFAIVEIVRNSDSTISLFWNCVSGATYRVEFCDLPDTGLAWQTAEAGIGTSVTGVHEWVDDGTGTGSHPGSITSRLYRVVVSGP